MSSRFRNLASIYCSRLRAGSRLWIAAIVLVGCGANAAVAAETRIVGGKIAGNAQFPWMVAIVDSSFNDPYNGQFCGGTLIAPRWVLSAAHCFLDSDGNPDRDPADVDVVIGLPKLNAGSKTRLFEQSERLRAKAIYTHPGFSGPGTTDFALIQLSQDALRDPVELLYGGTDLESPGETSRIMGWGWLSEDGGSAPNLMTAEVDILDRANCAAAYGSGFNDTALICAGLERGGVDACKGDSGGPLLVEDPATGNLLQAGVVSFGRGCARPDSPGVYARVSNVTGWIERTRENAFGPAKKARQVRARIAEDCDYRVCTLSGAGSSYVNGPIMNYLWQFEDGRSMTGREVQFQFPPGGGYQEVTLQVSDGAGRSHTTSHFLAIASGPGGGISAIRDTRVVRDKQRIFYPNNKGSWWDRGELDGLITATAGIDLQVRLQRYYPNEGKWREFARTDHTNAKHRVRVRVSPGQYRWSIKSKSGASNLNIRTLQR